jgi:hypothetical protein
VNFESPNPRRNPQPFRFEDRFRPLHGLLDSDAEVETSWPPSISR